MEQTLVIRHREYRLVLNALLAKADEQKEIWTEETKNINHYLEYAALYEKLASYEDVISRDSYLISGNDI